MTSSKASKAIRMIAIDMDGTLLGPDGLASPANLRAMLAAEAAGIEVVIATGRRHAYAMRILRRSASTPRSSPPRGPDAPNSPECSRVFICKNSGKRAIDDQFD